jgi:hypothetical protein
MALSYFIIGLDLSQSGVVIMSEPFCTLPDPPGCPKGSVPKPANDPDGSKFHSGGYFRVKPAGQPGPQMIVCAQFNTLHEANNWLTSDDGKRFVARFADVYVVRSAA